MQVEPSTRFANRALDSGELFLRRRSLYPAELRVHDGSPVSPEKADNDFSL